MPALLLGVLSNAACSTSARVSSEGPVIVPFEFVKGDTAVVVPVTVDGRGLHLVLDTGAGIEAIAAGVAKELNIQVTETHTGKRLNGDPLTVGMGKARSVTFGSITKRDWPLAPMEYFDETSKEINVQGLLSLKFFEDHPFTIDYPGKKIIIETASSLAERKRKGFVTPIFTTQEIPRALGAEVDLEVDGKWKQRSIIDTGSAPTKLDMPYFEKMGYSPNDPRLKKKSNNTIAKTTTHAMFIPGPGRIRLFGSKDVVNDEAPIRFQEKLSAASIGGDFFMKYQVTFDLQKHELIMNQDGKALH